jgi:hypothetical protein
MPADQSYLSNLALGFGPVAGMKFGPGTNGRIGTVVLGTAIAFAIVAFAMAFKEPLAAVAILGIAALIVLIYLAAAYWYANRYPELSAMDSVHVAQVLTHEGAMRAPPGGPVDVAHPSMIDVTPVPNPKLASVGQEAETEEADAPDA